MKKVQQFCAVVVLAAALSLSTFAGDIQAPGMTSPPPPQPSLVSEIGTPGAPVADEIGCPDIVTLDPVTEAALSLLQSLLSLF
jgi:hypothetical protein